MATYLLGSNTSIESLRTVTFQNACNVVRELVALTIVQCFYSIYFHCEI